MSVKQALRGPLLMAGIIGLTVSGCAQTSSTVESVAQTSSLSVDTIYNSDTFRLDYPAPTRWLEDGSGYTTLESSATNEGRDIVRYHPETNERDILVSAEQLTPAGAEAALDIADYRWSDDGNKVLIFTNTKRSWRTHTLGDYWVLDRANNQLQKLGGTAPESTLQFAKFNPQGDKVAYVMQNNIYVQDLASMTITPITTDGNDYIVNGTFDWVNEEEFFLRDGFRWSPDGEHIAYWQLD
ncbi:MAG TPA: S9 family peptidase, partial [Idiomarina sp.]|nr:S9 family peptidase [Idiomarina sp.]